MYKLATLTLLTAAVLASGLAVTLAPGSPPAAEYFQRTWARTDKPVADLSASRTWMWGPQAFTSELQEDYADAPNGVRTVQYFDKSRMEDSSYRAAEPWDVTNGLLVVELMSGRLQNGDNSFEQRQPAQVNVGGDADDPTGPTYATMAMVRNAPPLSDNQVITWSIDRNGAIGQAPADVSDLDVTAAYRLDQPNLDHQVASVFWTFMTSSGLVWEDEQLVTDALFLNAFYATGYPVTEAYWAEIKVGGSYTWVLLQCFERRCLTYTPDNQPGWQVEAGNVGQHYYTWRYGQLPETPTPTPQPGTRTFYVSPSGDDADEGTQSQPWRSPAAAASRLQPGDTLVILSGSYILGDYETDIIRPPSGTAVAWITIRGEVGNPPVLAGRDDLAAAIDLSGASYVRLGNLEITHDPQASGEDLYFRDGILIADEPASNISLDNLYIHHIDEFGLNFQDVSNLEITNSRIEYAGFGAIGGPAGAAGGWRDVLIDGCSLSYSGRYYQGGDGTDRPYDRPDGFGIEPSAGPIEISNTTAAFNLGDGIDSKADNTFIHHTTVSNNAADGIKLWGDRSRVENTLIYGRGGDNPEVTPWSALVIAPEEREGTSFEIINVTIDDSLGQNYLLWVNYDYPNVPVNLTIRNTILSSRGPNAPVFFSEGTRANLDHNLFYVPDSDQVLVQGEDEYDAASITTLGSGNLYGNPDFVNPATPGDSGDYHLESGSPARDTGTSAGAPATDLEGNSRPQGNGYDRGAYEQ